ncbi:MAG: hypothetical protein WD969_00965 [Paracoccaceae bacterium]
MTRRLRLGADAPPKRSRIAAALLFGWLVLWSFGIAIVARALLAGPQEGAAPMTIWLVVALIGWLLGARLLLRALRGQPILGARRNGGAPQPARGDPAGEGDGID